MKRSIVFISLFLLQLFFFNDSFAQVNSKSQLPVNLQNGLVAFYPFNGNAGDSSGNGNNGTANNITHGNDRFGNPNATGVFTKANSSYYFYPASQQFQPTSFTLSSWFNTTIIQAGGLGSEKDQFIAGYSPNSWASGPSYSHILYVTSNSILLSRMWTQTTFWQDITTNSGTVNPNQWYNIITTYDSATGKQRFYINGVLNDERISKVEYFNQSGFYIGASRQNSSGTIGTFFDGKIDDVMFYNRALSSNEITQLYTGSFCQPGQEITINPLQDTTRVCGTSTTLDAGSGYASYSWNTGATTQSILPTQSGFYKVIVTNSNGCSASDSTYLSLVKAKIIQRDTTICKGASITLSVDSTISGSSNSSLPTNLKSGLVAYYPFNGNANDESGNGNNGTIHEGVTNTTDRLGNSNSALFFDGNNGYISVSKLDNLKYSPITYSAWVIVNSYFPSSFGHKFRAVIGRNTAYVLDNGVIGLFAANNVNNGINDNTFLMWRGGWTGNEIPTSKIKPDLNKWIHIVYTQEFDGTWKWYQNGILTNSGTFNQPQGDYNFFQIGGCNNQSNGNTFWNDKLDDIGVWNRVLTQNEVKTLYNQNDKYWSNGAISNSITVTPTQTTKYFVTVSDGITSCQDSVTVNVFDPLTYNPLQDTLMVCADSVILDAGTGFVSYKWSNDSSSQRIKVSVDGKYKLSVNDLSGCTLTDSSYIEFANVKILQQDTTIILGDSLELTSNVKQVRVSHALFNPGTPNPWSFPGSLNGGYIPLGTFGPQNKFSVSMWVKPEAVQTSGINILLDCSHGGSSNWVLQTLNSGATWTWGSVEFSLASNKWQHLLMTYDNGVKKVFIDGKLISTLNQPISYVGNPNLYLGNWPEGARRFFGSVDELYVTNNILYTENFIPQQEYNTALPNSLGLWHFNEGSGSITLNSATVQNSNINSWSWINRGSIDSISTSIRWSTNDTSNTIKVKPLTSTSYTLTKTKGAFVCSDTINVSVINGFSYEVFPDTIRVFKDSVILDAGSGYNRYSWSDNSSSQTINVKKSGVYKVYVTNSSGQMAADQTYVNIIDANIIQNDLTICKTDSVTLSLDTTFFISDTTIKSRVDSSNRSEKFSSSFKNTGNFNSPWGSVHHDYMGNIIVSGSYTGAINIDGNTTNSYGGTDFFVKKYDSKGNTKWMIDGGSSGSQDFIGTGWSKGIATDKNGNVYFAGRYNQTLTIRGTGGTSFTGTYVPTSNVNHNDGFVVKLDSTGKVVWGVTINGASNDGFDAVTVDPNGNIICLGGLNGCCPSSFVANINGPVNAVTVQGIGYGTGLLVKLSPTGEILWNCRMGNRDVSFGNAVTDADGNIYFTGSQRSWSNGIAGTLVDGSGASSSVLNPGIGLGFLIKLNANGVRQYAIPIGNNGLGEGTSTSVTGIQIKNNRDIYIAGSYAGDLMVFNSTTSSSLSLPASSSYAGFIAKYSKDGVPLTVKQVKKSALGETNLTVIDIDSSFIAVTGYFTGGNAGLNDGAYILYDESLNQLKTKNIGGSLDEYTKGLTISNGQVFVTGNYDASTKFDGEIKVGSGSYLWVADTLYSFEQPRYKYKWSTGDTTSSIKVLIDSSRKYFVEVTDGSRLSKDSVSVNIFGQSFNPLKDTLKFRAFSADLDAGAGFAQYKWNTGDTTQKITIRTSGAYKVIVSNGNGCTSSDSSIVSVIDVNIVQKDTTICKGASIQLGIDSTNAITLSDSLPANLRNGLLAYYPFNGNANDESGNGNNGVVNGAGLTADRFGVANAAYLFLSNNSINTPIVLENTTNYSIGGWFKTTSGGTIVGGRELNGPSGLSMVVQSNSTASTYLGQVLWENDNAYGGVGQMSSSAYLDNSWHFIVGTFSNSSPLILPTDFKLYVDGVLLNSLSVNSSTPIPTSPITNTTNFLIGNHRIWPNAGFNGLLDDIIFYNRTLTQEDVSQLYQVQNTVSWSNGATSNSITISPTQTTKYYVTVSDGITSCQDSITVNVFGSDFNPFADTIISKQNKVTLDAGVGYSAYKWNTGKTTQQIEAITNGNYEVEVSNDSGCKASDKVNVNLFNAVINQNDTTLCKNDSITLTLQEVLPQIDYSTTSMNGWKLLIPGSSYNGASTNFLSNNFDPVKSKLYSYLNQTAYEFDLNNLIVRSIPISGTPLDYHDMVYDFTNERLLTKRVGRDAVFALPIAGGSWSQVGSGGFDSESYGSSSYWNPLTNRVGYFGGYGWFATKNWIWENQGSNGWLNVYANNNNCNPAKRNGQLARNTTGNKMYLFSGQGSCDGNQFASTCSNSQPWATDVGVYCWLKDLWEIDLSNYTFTNVLPINSPSVIREGSFAHDFDKDVFYNIGGYVPSPTYNTNYGAVTDFSNEVTRFRRGIDQGFVPISVGGDVPPLVKLNDYAGRAYYDSKYKRIVWARKDGIWAMSTQPSSNITYSWSTGDTTRSIRVAANSSIKIYGTVSDGVNSSTDSILLNILSADTSLNILDAPQLCSNSGSVRIQAGSASSYKWLKDGIVIPGATSILYNATQAGAYRVVVSNENGCSDSSRVVNITLRPSSVAGNITGSSSVCSGTNTTALTLGGYTGSIQWQSSLDNSYFTNIGDATSPINTASNLTATTYFRAIVSNGICLSDTTSTAIITVNQPPSSSIAIVTHPTCFTSMGTITVTATGVATDTYSIDGINYQSSNIFLGVAAGTYIATVKSDAGCISNAVDVILNAQPATPTAPTVNVTQPTCATSTGTITVTVTGVSSDTYSIDGINYQSINIFLGVAAGTYIATVKSVKGCISNAIDVIVNAQPVTPTAPSVNVTQPTCFTSTGTITLTSTGILSDTYSIDGTSYQSSNIFSGVSTGIYIAKVKSVEGCISNAIDVIVNAQPATPSSPVLNVTHPTCFTSNGTITVTATGVATDTYSIDGTTYQSSNIFFGVSAVNYSVTVKSVEGCISNAIDVIVNTQPATPSSPLINVTQPTCATSSGTITVTATRVATDTYSINGTTYQLSNIFTSVAPGTYNVTVKSAAGCISGASTLAVNAQPRTPAIPVANVIQPTCAVTTGTITVTSTGVATDTYSINGATYQSSNIFSGLAAGTYSVTVKSAAGCASSARAYVVNALPIIDPISGGTAVCIGSSIQLGNSTPNGIWKSASPLVASISATGAVTGLTAGKTEIYYEITNEGSCVAIVSTTITVNPSPVVATITGTASVCVGSTSTLANATPAGLWTTDSPNVATVSNTGVVTGISAGLAVISYTVTVNGCSSTSTKTITVNALPVVSDIAGIQNICVGTTSIFASFTSGGTWSSQNTAIATVSNSGLVTGVSAGTTNINYSVTVSGCTTTVSRIITVNAVPSAPSSITITSLSDVCGNRVYRYAAPALSGNATGYQWSFVGTLGLNALLDSGTLNSQVIRMKFTSNVAAATGDSVRVQYTSAGCNSLNRALRLTNTVLAAPTAPASITITTISDVCGSRVYRYTAPALTGSASGYQWSFVGILGLTAVLDSGSLTSRTIRMKFASNAAAARGDSARVAYTSSCGNSLRRSLRLTNTSLTAPSAPASITVTSVVDTCGGRIFRYTAPALTGSASGYLWSFVGALGTGASIDSGSLTSRIIRMKFASNAAAATGDSVRVAYTSSCGNSLRRSLRLTNTSLTAPSAPASITVTFVVDTCGGRIFRYAAPALTGSASGYLWSFVGALGTGASIDSGSLTSRTIRMKFASNAAAAAGDSVRVKYTSSCGTSPNRSLRLTNTVLTAPTTSPASITVALVSNVCSARVYRYSASALTTNATGFQWSFVGNLGTNAVVDSGSLTSRIVRIKYTLNTAASTGDSVRVAFTSGCGIGPRRTLRLTNLALANCPQSSLIVNLTSSKNSLLPTSNDQKVLEVNVFPNPTAGLFNLNVKSSSVEIVRVRVLDVRGRVMKSLKTTPSVTTLNDLNLLPGVYFFEVKQGNEMKIVKAVKL